MAPDGRQATAWPRGGGEIAALVRSHDWGATPLGPIAAWPDRLRAAVELMLDSPLPAALLCGPQRIFLYNEAASRLCGHHPEPFGRPLADALPEGYPGLAPLYDRVFAGEPAQAVIQVRATSEGAGPELYHAHLTPIRGEDGEVAHAHMAWFGLRPGLAPGQDRQAFLLALSDAIRGLADPLDIQDVASRLLGERLGVDRAVYKEVEEEDGMACFVVSRHFTRAGVAGIPGRHDVAGFGAALAANSQAGRTTAIQDIERDPRLAEAERGAYRRFGIRSYVAVPLVKDRRFVALLAVHEGEPCAWRPDDVALIEEVAERTWAAVERARAEAALRQSERRLQTLVEGVPQLVWRAADSGRWTWASPQWTRFTGQSAEASLGLGWLEPVHPDDWMATLQLWAEAPARGGFEADYRIRNRDEGRYRWFQTRATPVRDEAGGIIEWLGTSTDVDDLRRLQDRQQVLVAELQHRTRNLLGVTRAMAEATMRRSASIAEFRPRFRDRLAALSRVQGLLSRLAEGDRISFDALIRDQLSALGWQPDDAGRVVLAGPDGVGLRSRTVQTLAMALHELATNALKYGALRQPAGRLRVAWRLEATEPGEETWLHVDWTETGVVMPPADARPRGGGQGRELIERALPYQLGARTRFLLGADGVRCSIALPVPAA
jgi:PAS domain S-box-containing protein